MPKKGRVTFCLPVIKNTVLYSGQHCGRWGTHTHTHILYIHIQFTQVHQGPFSMASSPTATLLGGDGQPKITNTDTF